MLHSDSILLLNRSFAIIMKEIKHKPVIETLINTAALALTAAGTQQAMTGNYLGLGLIVFGAGLEFFKYWGRKNNYW